MSLINDLREAEQRIVALWPVIESATATVSNVQTFLNQLRETPIDYEQASKLRETMVEIRKATAVLKKEVGGIITLADGIEAPDDLWPAAAMRAYGSLHASIGTLAATVEKLTMVANKLDDDFNELIKEIECATQH